MNQRVRVGLIGSQFISHIHNLSLKRCAAAEVFAVASPTPGNAQKFAAKHDIPHHFTDYRKMFDKMANLPIPSWIAAPVVSYAEFILPICLVLGFGARFAALGLLVMTVMISAFVAPQALWTTHIYWAAILVVLMSLGPGVVSIDHLIRRLYKR